MPLYEYKCKACGCEFEELASFAEADRMPCANCGSMRTERLMSSFSDSSSSDSGDAPSCFSGGG